MVDSFKVSELVAAEEELQQLKKQYGEPQKEPLWKRVITAYVEKKAQGMVYLLLFFTGISFLMSVLDIWYALFLETDENKCIAI